MKKEIYKVTPIVCYPPCILVSGRQFDCRKCNNKDECKKTQPRSMCIRPYKNHTEGCPNFGKSPICPPQIPCMYDQVFDLDEVYAVATLLT